MHGHSSRRRQDAAAFYPFLSPHFQLPFYWAFILYKSFFSLKIGTFTKVMTNSDNSMNISNLTTHQTQTNRCS